MLAGSRLKPCLCLFSGRGRVVSSLLLLLYQCESQCCQVLCSCHFFRKPSQYVSNPFSPLPLPQCQQKGTCLPFRWRGLWNLSGRHPPGRAGQQCRKPPHRPLLGRPQCWELLLKTRVFS